MGKTITPQLRITDLRKIMYYRCACLYAWKRKDQWLYIGSSQNGTYRLRGHHIINKVSFQEGDVINVYFLNTISDEELQWHEYNLIEKYRPLYNASNQTPLMTKILKQITALERDKQWIQDHSV